MGKNRGFTLIELMVTIAILAIIATLAAPAFSNMALAQNFNKSTQNLVAQLNQARSTAVLERRSVEVKLNSSAADTASILNWQPEGSAHRAPCLREALADAGAKSRPSARLQAVPKHGQNPDLQAEHRKNSR